LQYVAGVYYYRNNASTPTPFRLSNVSQYQTRGVTEAISGYFDGSYDLGDWVLIGGLRYTQEDRRSDTHFFLTSSQAVGDRHQEDTEKVWTPRIGLRYELSPDANLYATYTRGYKAGIFDTTSATSAPVDPEFIDAYEVGFKTTATDYTFNAAAYFYNFTDTQVNSFVIDAGTGALFSRTLNANAAEIYGIDLDGTYRFNDSWDVRGALAYTHARYTDFPNAPNYGGGTALLNVLLQDVAGNSMVRAPDWSSNATVNYHAGLGGEMRLDASLSGAYSSRVFFDFANERSQKSYILVDGNATLSFNDHLNVSIYAQNLTDEIYKRSSGYSVVGTAQTFGAPRTYGVSLGVRF
jgi:iron complex outermembrane receptor protein